MSTTSDDIPDLSAVRLTETVEGIEAGSYGTVVQIYQGSALAETGYEVEFSNPSRVVVVARSQIEFVAPVADHTERARALENCASDAALLAAELFAIASDARRWRHVAENKHSIDDLARHREEGRQEVEGTRRNS